MDSDELTVTEILHQIGVPAHIKGYQFLRDAILLTMDEPDYINAAPVPIKNQNLEIAIDLSEIETAVMEPNGKISFLPKAENRPVTPNDIALSVPKSGLCFNLVIDGKVLESNLISAGQDKNGCRASFQKASVKQ